MSNHHPPQSSEQTARQQAQLTSESAAPQQAFVDTRARLLRPADLLQLQRSIGNRATGQLVLGRRRSEEPAQLPVQRTIDNITCKDDDNDNIQAAKTFFSSINDAVQKAYQYAVMFPHLGGYADIDGHTKHWVDLWQAYIDDEKPKLMAAAFGYVVESLVSNKASEFYVKAPSSCTIATQVVSGGTRPDFVLYRKNKSIAWADITAEGSVDHIFSKDDWESKISIFAEILYPSLDPGTLMMMRQNKDNKGSISKEEFEKRAKAAREEYQRKKKEWEKLGQQFMKSYHSDNLKKIPQLSTKDLQNINTDALRMFIRIKIMAKFNANSLEEKLVPSILAAMGVGSGQWGFNTGYSVSQRAGEAWLVDHPI